MALFDKITGKDADRSDKPVADFSDVTGGSSSTAPPPQAPGSDVREYTVVSGDSLSAIAKRTYGDASKWHAIYDANKDQISNPDLIHPGQKLRLPANP